MIQFNLTRESYGGDTRSQGNENGQMNSLVIGSEEPPPQFFDPRSESQRLRAIPIVNLQLASYVQGDEDISNMFLLPEDPIIGDNSSFSLSPPSPFSPPSTRSPNSSEQTEDSDVYCKEELPTDVDGLSQSTDCPPSYND
jgi:hypothetical protein